MLAAFWLVVLSPKRERGRKPEAGHRRSSSSSLEQAQQAAAAGEQAREDFPVDYRRLVVLGKAVPADGDQAGLLVQLQRLADRSGVGFQSIDLSRPARRAPPRRRLHRQLRLVGVADTAGHAPAELPRMPPPRRLHATAAPTEAAAATLPIGASVGPAGLPVMPYDLKFTGDFFQIADFLKSSTRWSTCRTARSTSTAAC